jgi:hypothetical protein
MKTYVIAVALAAALFTTAADASTRTIAFSGDIVSTEANFFSLLGIGSETTATGSFSFDPAALAYEIGHNGALDSAFFAYEDLAVTIGSVTFQADPFGSNPDSRMSVHDVHLPNYNDHVVLTANHNSQLFAPNFHTFITLSAYADQNGYTDPAQLTDGLPFLTAALLNSFNAGRNADVLLLDDVSRDFRLAHISNLTFTDVVAAVPLPATWSLLAGGLGLLGAFALRRKRGGDNRRTAPPPDAVAP